MSQPTVREMLDAYFTSLPPGKVNLEARLSHMDSLNDALSRSTPADRKSFRRVSEALFHYRKLSGNERVEFARLMRARPRTAQENADIVRSCEELIASLQAKRPHLPNGI